MPDELPSNWKQATQAAAAELAALICRNCGAANRPGVVYVEITQNGSHFCTVCGKPSVEAVIEQAARAHGAPKDIHTWAHRLAKDVGGLID